MWYVYHLPLMVPITGLPTSTYLLCSQCVLLYFSTRMQLAAYVPTRFLWAVAVEWVEAETDDLPVKHVVVPRNQYGQLCVDSIKDLAGSGKYWSALAMAILHAKMAGF